MSKFLKIGLIIGGAILVLLVVLKSTGTINSNSKGITVETGIVSKNDIVETVTASGKIQPETEVKLSPEVSGEIIELTIKEGDKVSKGDLLVKINPDVYESAERRARAAVKSAKASVNQSEAQYVEAKKAYDRYKKLYNQKVISDAEFEGYERAYVVADLARETAASNLESAKASLSEAQDNLKRTTILAPQDGTVSMLNVELGERVVGTAQMAGTELLRVANLANMEVLVEVNENDIVRVSLGDTAEIEVDAYLDEKFLGVVTEIANSANIQGMSADQVTNFEVKVMILPSSYEKVLKEGQESPFRPGMTASVDIRTHVVRDVLSVPIQAVTIRTDTSVKAKRYRQKETSEEGAENTEEFEVVFLNVEGRSKLQVVKTGIQDDKNIVIEDGLEEGQEVVVGPYSAVSKRLKSDDELNVEGDSKTKKKEEKDK